MLQLLERILGLVVKAAEGLRTHRGVKLRADFAWNLTQCYLRLLEIVEDGESIVRQIEFFVRRFGEHLEKDDDWKYIASEINTAVLCQSVNIVRLDGTLHDLAPTLLVLAQHEAYELGTFLAGKRSVLRYLSNILKDGRLALDVQYAPDTESPQLGRSWARGGVDIPTERGALIVKGIAELDTRGDWGITQYKALATFLEERRPRDILESMRSHAEQLASLIKSSFTLEEILNTADKLR
jgi:hypothetical protein